MSRKAWARLRLWGISIATAGMGWALLPGGAIAGNAIFNEDLVTLEIHFGRYYTRLTHANGTRTYTFNPSGLKRAIPELPDGTKFAIEFVDGKAKNAVLDFSALDSASADLYGEAIASRFFEYILGWEPPVWSELNFSAFGAVIEESLEYCLGDGVATA